MSYNKLTKMKQMFQNVCNSSKLLMGAMGLLAMSSASVQATSITPTRPAMSGDTFLISNASELYWLADSVNHLGGAYLLVKQTADIEVNAGGAAAIANPTAITMWTPIGDTLTRPFGGVYDGQGHTITGLICQKMTLASFFGYVTNGEIKNLTIDNSYFYAMVGSAAICGGINSGYITNCVSGVKNVITGYSPMARYGQVAGICAGANYSFINGCKNYASITAANSDCVGGIVGLGQNATISQCANNATITGKSYVGGLAGYLFSSEVSDNHMNGGIATAQDTGRYIGALVGTIDSASIVTNNTIDYCTYGTIGHNMGIFVGAVKDGSQVNGNYGVSIDATDYNRLAAMGCVDTNASVAEYNYYEAASINGKGGLNDSVLKSGEACYLLNGKSSVDAYWKQQLYTETRPSSTSDATVYYLKNKSGDYIYTNRPDTCYTVLHLVDSVDFVAPADLHADTVTYTREISNQIGSLCLPFKFKRGENVSKNFHFYNFALFRSDSTAIVLSETDSIEAGVPTIFLADDATEPLYIEKANVLLVSAPATTNNFMTGTFATDTVRNQISQKYYLKDNMFYRGNTYFIIPAYRAFIHRSGKANTLNTLGIIFGTDNENESIEESISQQEVSVEAIYNVAGQKVNRLEKGKIYILRMSDGTSKKAIIEK